MPRYCGPRELDLLCIYSTDTIAEINDSLPYSSSWTSVRRTEATHWSPDPQIMALASFRLQSRTEGNLTGRHRDLVVRLKAITRDCKSRLWASVHSCANLAGINESSEQKEFTVWMLKRAQTRSRLRAAKPDQLRLLPLGTNIYCERASSRFSCVDPRIGTIGPNLAQGSIGNLGWQGNELSRPWLLITVQKSWWIRTSHLTADAMLHEAASQFLQLSAVGACSSPFDHVAYWRPKGGKVRPSMDCALQ